MSIRSLGANGHHREGCPTLDDALLADISTRSGGDGQIRLPPGITHVGFSIEKGGHVVDLVLLHQYL